MPMLDFMHLKQRPACTFPEDPILGRRDSANCPPPMPLVIGALRSGTMLLSRWLSAHPGLAILPETGALPSILGRHSSAGPLTALEVHCLLTSLPGWPDLGVDGRAYLDALAPLHPFSVSDGLRTLYRLSTEGIGKPRWGDSITDDLERLHDIAYILPEAHFIHVYREGRELARPVQGMEAVPGHDMAAFARDWDARIDSARQQAERGLHYLEVRYADLIADPERILREVCAFVDLPLNPRMLSPDVPLP